MASRAFLFLCAASAACIAERGPFTNRMAHSATNYLARASRQPVNWQPWGREAFALAAKLDRPVLLYVGSDVCRWCTETDRAIDTDPEIGSLINALFVPVRVDRDERPDVAHRYHAAVERLAGLDGWPLTVFLTADGAPFFGGTYFPADDPITGRGLKQILPEVARSYHDQRSFILQQAAMVQQLVLTGTGESRGVLYPSMVRQEIAAVRRALDEAVHTRAATGSVMHAEAVALLLAVSAREQDTVSLGVARRALDLMMDTAAGDVGEDPPRLVRAALVGTLAKAWVVTGDERYRDLGRGLVRALTRDPPESARDRAIFSDQEAYVIEMVMLSAATFGEMAAGKRARSALDNLLQRTYARGWGVRHAISGASALQAGTLFQDQVQVASACLVAHQLTDESRYLDVALDLAAIMERGYADPIGGYYDVAMPAALVASLPPETPPPLPPPPLGDRSKHFLDDVLPGANAEAANFLFHLGEVTGDATYRRRAQATLEAFAGNLAGTGIRASTFLSAAWESMGSP